MYSAMETCVFLAFCCASGAHAKRLTPTNQAVADGLGFTPGGLQQAWISAIEPEQNHMPNSLHPRSTQLKTDVASLPMAPARVQFGQAPQLNSYEEGGLGPLEDEDMDQEYREYLANTHSEYDEYAHYPSEDEEYLRNMTTNSSGSDTERQSNTESSGSDTESDFHQGPVNMNGVDVSGSSLRSTLLTDTSGRRVPVSSLIGEQGKAVIVFLRHLGCPLCWDYALNWQKQQPYMAAAGIAGPLFISVGTSEQLQKFLNLHEELEGAQALVDDSADFAAYAGAGLNYLLGDKAHAAESWNQDSHFKPPSFGPSLWFKYLANSASLSPVRKCSDDKVELSKVPDGVKVLGGTFGIDGDVVEVFHQDQIPGDTPDIEAVLTSLGA